MTINKQDLDNHITGHYGEDQFRDDPYPNIQDDDYTISMTGPLYSRYYVSQVEREFANWDDAIHAICEHMKRSNWYPPVWFINDHGNIDLLAIDLDTGDNTIVNSWV